MSTVTTFPISTVFENSGTFTSDQNATNVDSLGARKLLIGLNVSALTGSAGVNLSVGGKAPDGNYYQIGDVGPIDGAGVAVVEGPIPDVLNVGIGLNGASSATVSYWVIGQA